MKKIMLSVILAIVAIPIFAQETTKPITSSSLFQKSKKQKTAAWICLGGGLALNTAALIIITSNATKDIASVFALEPKTHNYDGAGALSIIGAAAMIGSIPLFIASGRNKREANIMLKNEKVSVGIPVPVSRQIPGITLSIPIGR